MHCKGTVACSILRVLVCILLPVKGLNRMNAQETRNRFLGKHENATGDTWHCPKVAVLPSLTALEKQMAAGPIYGKRPLHQQKHNQSVPHYVFISGGAYSGTTALYGLVSTSPAVSNLCSAHEICCEGAWILMRRKLVPGRKALDPQFPKDWRQALNVYREYWNTSKPVLVDKSPANLMKFKHIWKDLRHTEAKVSFIYVIRSKCFGHRVVDGGNWTSLAHAEVTQIKALRAQGAPVHLVKYEDMLGNPAGVAEDLLDFIPELQSIDLRFQGLHDAPAVNKDDPRAVPLAKFVLNEECFPFFKSGISVSLYDQNLMAELGYKKDWFHTAPYIGPLDNCGA
eukprot:gnl/MRDRNA2_/MRDRNA2_27130_c0_seq1.p1 gnl/MRDRNA2_/MRDRNA2_27130_c0~~gnl/MRDRNA2_/MRDRNA2_27130_c0_seq1.p1  ORF type:complete len:340 (-),score=60.93 gnl/MRDRNA2_/MRDRNA2_27130_c0_seq1:82-1101(-)